MVDTDQFCETFLEPLHQWALRDVPRTNHAEQEFFDLWIMVGITIPSLAILLILYILFGLNEFATVLAIGISAFPAIAINVWLGVKSVDNNLRTPGSSNAGAKTERVVSDSWITTKVKSEILADSISKGFKVSVETKHGVVILTGALANQDGIDHVKDIAGKVDGVKSVDTTALVVANK